MTTTRFKLSLLVAALAGLAVGCGSDATTVDTSDAAVTADSSTTPADGGTTTEDGGTTPADGGTTPADGSTTTEDGGTTIADAGADAAATVEPYLTTALVVQTPFPSGTPTSALDCVAETPQPNSLSSGMDGDRRFVSVRCSITVASRLWIVNFNAFNATSGFNSTDTGHCGGDRPPAVLSNVSVLGGWSAGSCTPDYATRVIVDSVDYDARTISGSVDITLRSAPSGGATFNINGTFEGAWAAPTT